MDIVDEHQQACQLLVFGQAKLVGRLDGIDGVAARIGQTHHFGFGSLRLQHERRKVLAVQRVTHGADNFPAFGFDDVGGVFFQRMAESVIRCDEEPRVTAALDHAAAGHG